MKSHCPARVVAFAFRVPKAVAVACEVREEAARLYNEVSTSAVGVRCDARNPEDA
jgi:hypothetical protein